MARRNLLAAAAVGAWIAAAMPALADQFTYDLLSPANLSASASGLSSAGGLTFPNGDGVQAFWTFAPTASGYVGYAVGKLPGSGYGLFQASTSGGSAILRITATDPVAGTIPFGLPSGGRSTTNLTVGGAGFVLSALTLTSSAPIGGLTASGVGTPAPVAGAGLVPVRGWAAYATRRRRRRVRLDARAA